MATKFTNDKDYSLSVAVWLADDEYNHNPVGDGKKYISATSLLKPLRMIVLDQRARAILAESGDDVVEDLDRWVPSRLGTAIHNAIEHSWTRTLPDGTPAYILSLRRMGYPEALIQRVRVNPTAEELDTVKDIIPVYLEQRSFREINGWVVGGQFDFVGNGTLEDFKSMGVYGYMKGDKDEEQLMQGSIYKWLNPDLITSDHMLIQQIFTDWSKLDAMTKAASGYPQARIIEKTLGLQAVETWIADKLAEIDRLLVMPEAHLPKCTQKELWQDDPKFKYYKNPDAAKQGKRSTKNFDCEIEATRRLNKDGGVGVVVRVEQKVRRCAYCPGFDLCTQKDEYAAAGILHTL